MTNLHIHYYFSIYPLYLSLSHIIDGHRESTWQAYVVAYALSLRPHVHSQLQIPQAASQQQVEPSHAGHFRGHTLA